MEEPEVIEIDPFVWNIPECCREGWESCPHVVKRQQKRRVNKGL